MNLSGQFLIFTSEYPDWIKNGNFSEQEAIDIVKKHVNEVVAHYKGRVSRWVVVNEFHPVAWGRDDVLQRIVSPDLVDIAFQAAREADPDAKLIYNDNGNETPNSGATIITRSIAQRLSDKNLIDGIGVQMHVDGSNPPSREDIIRTMKGYGVPVYITEMDVNMKDVDVNNENRLKQQADVYKDIMQAALDSGVCESFCFWGIGDKYSWIETTKSYPFYSPNADPTPFDDNLQPKPAYYAILDVVKNAAHLRNG